MFRKQNRMYSFVHGYPVHLKPQTKSDAISLANFGKYKSSLSKVLVI